MPNKSNSNLDSLFRLLLNIYIMCLRRKKNAFLQANFRCDADDDDHLVLDMTGCCPPQSQFYDIAKRIRCMTCSGKSNGFSLISFVSGSTTNTSCMVRFGSFGS